MAIADKNTREEDICGRYQVTFPTPIDWPPYGLGAKRAIDILGALAGLVLLALPFLIIVTLIKLESGGSVFFVRERVGREGKQFRLWKFRTMVVDAINQGTGYTVSRNDSRITRVGHVLRVWSLDELPQLINVLRGEMSLVGPRPSWPHEVQALDDTQLGKIRVRPGVTGLAAIRGRNRVPWEKRLEIDNWYIDHWSLWLDLKVLALTPIKVVTREGIYGTGGINPSIVPHPTPTGTDVQARKDDAEEAERNG